MKEQIGNWMRIGKRLAILTVLGAGAIVLLYQPQATRAVECLESCDEQYSACNACCSGQDCSACESSCPGYSDCAKACHPSGSCWNQNICSDYYGRFYAQCMENNMDGECVDPNTGLVDAACCNSEAVQEYFGCCYP
jgi:hypothetical protein